MPLLTHLPFTIVVHHSLPSPFYSDFKVWFKDLIYAGKDFLCFILQFLAGGTDHWAPQISAVPCRTLVNTGILSSYYSWDTLQHTVFSKSQHDDFNAPFLLLTKKLRHHRDLAGEWRIRGARKPHEDQVIRGTLDKLTSKVSLPLHS